MFYKEAEILDDSSAAINIKNKSPCIMCLLPLGAEN